MKAILFGKQSNYNKVLDFIFLRLDIDYIGSIEYNEKVYFNGYVKNTLRIFSKYGKEIVILISRNRYEFNLIKQTVELLKRKYALEFEEKILNKGYYIEKIYTLKQKVKEEPEFI